MKCIHGGKPDDCKRCREKRGLPPLPEKAVKRTSLLPISDELTQNNVRRFCKTHKSIWGSGWWCLWALWMENIHATCEEEYLITV